ncbi:hypothetical protein BLNAU_9725 [Blattamonas nauphoetae]|uniref:Uncharacterized protein n=1 Tax=Blattamonas nauphoetae TaxID=2049346 RepID=A0ABQ9XV25_9EUKA|nr:hypothetical protein BLNAU_9725 [Blattamonas nauphoetae]
MAEELTSSLDLATKGETQHELLFGTLDRTNELGWVETFERIIAKLSEGRRLPEFGLETFLCFLLNRPKDVKPVFRSDGTFSLKKNTKIVSSKPLPSTILCSLLTHARPDQAASILAAFDLLESESDDEDLAMNLKCGLFSNVFDALTPSKLPFTSEFIPLHTQLVDVMLKKLDRIQKYAESKEHDQVRSEQDKICLSFLNRTKYYIVHLSLHPFAFVPHSYNNFILDFLTKFFRPERNNSVTKPFREKMRKAMNAAALTSPSPPFILTSELVCRLTNKKIMNVVDRIVALLESDSPIDDDTILRICAFHSNQLKCVYLPELFRKAGRSTELYFHTFRRLLSLPTDNFQLRPIKCLLCQKPHTLQPTLDEWDDVDLATVGVVLRSIDEDRLSFDHPLSQLNQQLLDFSAEILPQISHCATRLTPSQLERLLTPSIDLLSRSYLFSGSTIGEFIRKREGVFIEINRLCEQRVIVQCLSRIGFFSRVVDGLLDNRTSNSSECFLTLVLRDAHISENAGADRRNQIRRALPVFLEEGWQDALNVVLIDNTIQDRVNNPNSGIMGMMQFQGANVSSRIDWPNVHPHIPFIHVRHHREETTFSSLYFGSYR